MKGKKTENPLIQFFLFWSKEPGCAECVIQKKMTGEDMRGNEMREGGGLTRGGRWEGKMDGVSNPCKSATASVL